MKNTNKVMLCFSVQRKALTFPKLDVKESNPCPKKECKIQKTPMQLFFLCKKENSPFRTSCKGFEL
jgi:hypothetical protein